MTRTSKQLDAPPITVARIIAVHGVHGEVKVEPLSDFPHRFERGSSLVLDGAPVVVERSRAQGRNLILKLEGIDTRNAAEELTGKELTVAEAAAIEEEGVYYLHDVIGLRVEDGSGKELGRLVEVLSTGSNDVYVVRGEEGELLLPALEDVILRVDVSAGLMVVDVPPGIEFQAAAAPSRRPARRRPPASQGPGGGAP
jgi:16S rRNA processing protein RimM